MIVKSGPRAYEDVVCLAVSVKITAVCLKQTSRQGGFYRSGLLVAD
jgi:hypothetical protein